MLFCRQQFFFNKLFGKILSGIPSECQTVWIQIKPDILSGPDLGPNYLQRLSENGTSRQRVNKNLGKAVSDAVLGKARFMSKPLEREKSINVARSQGVLHPKSMQKSPKLIAKT